MRPGRLLAAVTAALVLAAGSACLPAAAAESETLAVTNLRVAGGEGAWHAEPAFHLNWDQVPGPPSEARAVVYQLYDPSGNPIGGPGRNEKANAIDSLRVPPVPGAYSVRVWLESDLGQLGSPDTARLLFDDSIPPPPLPQQPAAWLAGDQVALLRIGHPVGSLPLSGIRGYAVSLGEEGLPCAGPLVCTPAETDLPGGVEDDSLALGTFPEGTTVVRVASVSGSGVPSEAASVAFHVDATVPQVTLGGLPQGWSAGPVHLTAVAADALSGMAAAGPAGPFTAIAVDGRGATIGFGDTTSAWVSGSGVHAVSFYARDAAGNVADGELGAPAPSEAEVRIDEDPPRVAFAAAQDPSEPERIEATVSDALSGPSGDRGSIAIRPAGGGRFESMPTAVAGTKLIAHWDSDAYPAGAYEFRATGYDRAGNAAGGSGRQGGGRMVLVNPLKTPVELEAGFGDRRLSSRTVSYGRGVRFGGRLRTVDGSPLGGLEVAVTETFAAGARSGRGTTYARTGADGSFSVRLAPGPSRDVVAEFPGTPLLSRAGSRTAHLGAEGAVRLRASTPVARVGGAPVVFRGSVGRAGVAPRREGLPVELQFRFPGAGWREFRTVETDRRGRFRYAYRFSDDDSRGVRFQFRALVEKEGGWPYEPAASRPVVVTGR